MWSDFTVWIFRPQFAAQFLSIVSVCLREERTDYQASDPSPPQIFWETEIQFHTGRFTQWPLSQVQPESTSTIKLHISEKNEMSSGCLVSNVDSWTCELSASTFLVSGSPADVGSCRDLHSSYFSSVFIVPYDKLGFQCDEKQTQWSRFI